jgi:hypothetical protein
MRPAARSARFSTSRRTCVAARRRDGVADLVDFENRRLGFALADEGADALDADDRALLRQLPQRAVDGHPRDRQPLDQILLGGHARARPEFAADDPFGDIALDPLVERPRRAGEIGLGHPRAFQIDAV